MLHTLEINVYCLYYAQIVPCMFKRINMQFNVKYACLLNMIVMIHVGKQESAEAVLAALQVVPEPLKSMANVLVDICAYAGMYNSFFLLK